MGNIAGAERHRKLQLRIGVAGAQSVLGKALTLL
jgi:hypothetical protein